MATEQLQLVEAFIHPRFGIVGYFKTRLGYETRAIIQLGDRVLGDVINELAQGVAMEYEYDDPSLPFPTMYFRGKNE